MKRSTSASRWLVSLATFVLGAQLREAIAQAPDQHVLRIGLQATLEPLDLALSERTPTAVMLSAVYERLVNEEIGPDGQERTVPGVARSWSVSPDGLSWTFELARGHRFSSGEEVTATAVKFSIERLVGIGRGPAANFTSPMKITTPDRYHVVIALSHADPLLLSTLASMIGGIVDPRAQDHAAGKDFASQWLSTHTAGSGPYQLGLNVAGEGYRLIRNPYFQGGPQGPDNVTFEIIPDSETRTTKLEHGDLDIALWLPIEMAERAAQHPGIGILEGPAPYFTFVAMNTERGPMSDVRRRRALNDALDRQGIVKYLLAGHAAVFDGPEAAPGDNAAPHGVRGSIAPAAPLPPAPVPIRIIYIDEVPEAELIGTVVQATMSALHQPTQLRRLALPGFIDRIERGEYDIAIIKYLARSNDPLDTVGYWLNSNRMGIGGNYARYRNEHVDQLLSTARREMNPEARVLLVSDATRIARPETPYVYIAKHNQWITYRTCLKGLKWNAASWYRLNLSDVDVSGCAQ